MRTQEKAAWAMADEGQEAQLLAEVAEALRAALVAPSSTPAARSFVEAVQAVLTVRTYMNPLLLQRYPLIGYHGLCVM